MSHVQNVRHTLGRWQAALVVRTASGEFLLQSLMIPPANACSQHVHMDCHCHHELAQGLALLNSHLTNVNLSAKRALRPWATPAWHVPPTRGKPSSGRLPVNP